MIFKKWPQAIKSILNDCDWRDNKFFLRMLSVYMSKSLKIDSFSVGSKNFITDETSHFQKKIYSIFD